jgi:AcrR family transcriptional regulator
MNMSEIRIPTQKRSIEKRNRIIEKGFELMCENGYYNTTIPDIAKAADVSVGIIYQYFNDKKDIFIEGVNNYSNNIMYPMLNILETKEIKITDLRSIMEGMIDNFIKTHTITKKAHEELMAMSHLDEDVADIFKNSELKMTEKIVSLLENNNIHPTNAREKVHIAVGLIDNLCHEIVYHKHESFDYELMKEEVINIIVNILK